MKTILKISVIFCLSLLFWQCSMNKDGYLKDFEKFINKTEKDSDSLSQKEWEKIQAQYHDYCEKYYEQFKEELTDDDKIKIGFLKGKFSSISFRREATQLKKDISDTFNESVGFIKGASDQK